MTQSRLKAVMVRSVAVLVSAVALAPVWVGVWLAFARGDGPWIRLNINPADVFLAQVVNVAVIALPIAALWIGGKWRPVLVVASIALIVVRFVTRSISVSAETQAILDALEFIGTVVCQPIICASLAKGLALWWEAARK
ncbi:MAG: hypothetical protein IT207_05435 [Fimbriimonadaceae bacterium]|nr:hypothetical protein [Fimbriimonadaceae bacterium]